MNLFELATQVEKAMVVCTQKGVDPKDIEVVVEDWSVCETLTPDRGVLNTDAKLFTLMDDSGE